MPQPRPLGHTKTMLLVNHYKPEIAELHIVLNHGMSADKYMQTAVKQLGMRDVALFLAGGAGEQAHIYPQWCHKLAHCLIMLGSKYFRRSHQACLITVIERDKHRKQGYQSLAAPHIALKQTVHLPSAPHVGAYLFYHALLCSGKRKRQLFEIKTVEIVPHTGKTETTDGSIAPAAVAQYVELKIEQLLKLQPQARSLKPLIRHGIMYVGQRLAQPRKAKTRNHRLRQSLMDHRRSGKHTLHPAEYLPRADTLCRQFLGKGIYPAQPLRRRQCLWSIDFGMHH